MWAFEWEGCSLGVMIKVELHNKFSKTKPVTRFTFVNFYICTFILAVRCHWVPVGTRLR